MYCTPAIYNREHKQRRRSLLAVSSSAITQHLKRRVSKTIENLMKDEIAAFICPEILLLIP